MIPFSQADTLHPGLSEESVHEKDLGDDALCCPAPISSGFTAINREPIQLVTPRSSITTPATATTTTTPNQQHLARRRRRHNFAVARYLGFGDADEPAHLKRLAPLPAVHVAVPPKPAYKQQKLVDGDGGSQRTVTAIGYDRYTPKQSHVSEAYREVEYCQAPRKTITSKTISCDVSRQLYASTADLQRNSTERSASDPTLRAQSNNSPCCSPASSRTISHGTVFAASSDDRKDLGMIDCRANNQNLHAYLHAEKDASQDPMESSAYKNEDYDDSLDDEILLTLIPELQDASNVTIRSNSSSSYKSDLSYARISSTTNTTIDVNEQMIHSQIPSQALASPVSLANRLLTAKGTGSCPQKPIARPRFPVPVRDRSPIVGLSCNTLLKTCFRIGEAINQGFYASKSSKHVIIELYARILHSNRTETQQVFTFCDIFHAKPPHIKGTYSGALWKSVRLFEYDSRRLLQQGKLCRCIGTMKCVDKEWMVTVLNIWEATWDDVEWVEGIVKS